MEWHVTIFSSKQITHTPEHLPCVNYLGNVPKSFSTPSRNHGIERVVEIKHLNTLQKCRVFLASNSYADENMELAISMNFRRDRAKKKVKSVSQIHPHASQVTTRFPSPSAITSVLIPGGHVGSRVCCSVSGKCRRLIQFHR